MVRPQKACALRSIKEPLSEHEETKRLDEVAGFLGLLCCSLSPFGSFWIVLGRSTFSLAVLAHLLPFS